jgi:hypothetical protein
LGTRSVTNGSSHNATWVEITTHCPLGSIIGNTNLLVPSNNTKPATPDAKERSTTNNVKEGVYGAKN